MVYNTLLVMGILGQIFLLLFKLIRQRKKKQRENPGVLRNSAEPHIYYRKLLGEHGGGKCLETRCIYTEEALNNRRGVPVIRDLLLDSIFQ